MNVSKFHFVNFSARRTLSTISAVEIKDAAVETVQSVRYLDLILDILPNWRPQVTYLCSNLSRRIGVLNKRVSDSEEHLNKKRKCACLKRTILYIKYFTKTFFKMREFDYLLEK